MTATTSTITYFATDTRNDELERLIRQDAYFGEFTQELLERAGLAPGMRVLDLGTGAGDVALRVTQIVGPSGAVVGIDREESAIGFARQRAAKAGVENVTFVASDLDSFVADEPFDAIVGRMVLSFLPDPAVTLRRLLRSLKPGGVVAIQEMYRSTTTSAPEVPVLMNAVERIWTTFSRLGSDLSTSLRLGSVFEEAGLPTPTMRLHAHVERGAEAGAYRQIAAITRTLLPWMEQLGIATAEEVDVDSLEDRLRAAVINANSTLISPAMLSAWTRLA